MDPGTPAALSPFRADSEDLLDFVEELREAGYRVGLEEHIAAQNLLLALAARGESLDDPERLKRLLGPLLCNTPQEQSDFGPRCDRWLRRQAVPPEGPALPPKHQATLETWDRGLSRLDSWWRRLLRMGLLAAALLVSLYLVLWAYDSFGWLPDIDPSQGYSGSVMQLLGALAVPLVGLAALGLAGWLVWWWRVHRFLRRRVSSASEEVSRVAVGPLRRELFPRLLVARIAQDFRRRREVPSTDLDVEATLERTVRRGGWLAPVYGVRQVTPEYLVLIDRVGPDDQQARLFDELLDRLAEQGVFLARYSFDRDPRICFPRRDPTSPVTLQALTALHPGDRLLLFSDGAGLFTPLRPELEPWTDLLASWEHRALLTPELQEHWGFRETALSELLTVLPATLEGLSGVIRSIERRAAAKRNEGREGPPFPDDLRDWPLRWTDRRPPEPSHVERVLAGLRRFLGDDGFQWLSACAVYPALEWDLTLHLGSALQDEAHERLLSPERLARLVRAPWLRHGYMPDWLRILLIAYLPRAKQREVRLAVQAWLLSAHEGMDGGSVLEVARQHQRSFSALARHALRRLARREPEDSPLRDRVFLTFLSGRRNLAIRLPAPLRPVLRKAAPPAAVEAHVGNPWERRREVGFWRGFFQTWRMFTFSPARAFSQTRQTGDVASAFLFAGLIGVFSSLLSIPVAFLSVALGLGSNPLEALLTSMYIGIGVQLMAPLTWGLIIHGTLWVGNRFRPLQFGLDRTLRTLCYAGVGYVPYLVFGPATCFGCITGGISYPWWLVLCIVGLTKILGLSRWRAVLAVFSLPIGILLVWAALAFLSGVSASL